jgi:predicted DNA-binding antitoxin AbrB/MazE fold protein
VRVRSAQTGDIASGKHSASNCDMVSSMRPVEARYEDGLLKPAKPLPLRPGENVAVIVVRQPDPKRWNLAKLAATSADEDVALAEAGLSDWAEQLDSEDGVATR